MATNRRMKGGFVSEWLAAGGATAVASIVTNPLEVVKTRLQLQGELAMGNSTVYRGFFHGLGSIYSREGLAGLQRGLGTAMTYQFFLNGCRLGMYGDLKRLTRAEDKEASFRFLRTLLAGGTAGAAGALIASPIALIKVRQQTQAGSAAQAANAVVGHQHKMTGAVSALRAIVRAEGVLGLYRGADAGAMRAGVGSAAQLASYDFCKQFLKDTGGVSEGVGLHFASSLLAGLVVTTAMNPFDVVSTRLYNQKVVDGQGAWYRGPFHCLRATVMSEGVRGLYKGWLAHYVRLGPHTILTFVVWEQFKQQLGLRVLGEEGEGAGV